MDDLQLYSESASWLEISSDALQHNISVFKTLAGERFSAGFVLKGNAYGHGLETVFPVVHDLIDCVYVITPQDAFRMRAMERNAKMSQIRIVVLGALSVKEILECARLQIEMVIGDMVWREAVPKLKSSGLKAVVHLHLDTGLSREGFDPNRLKEELVFLKDGEDTVSIKGVMSHFANTEDVTEQKYAESQLATFKKGVGLLRNALSLSGPLEEHLAASAAVLVLPAAQLDRVRVGISLYGFWPSAETRISAKLVLKDLPVLEPVLSWRVNSQIVKKIKRGTYVGYGCTYRCENDQWIAVFPVGYYDGYPRLSSGKAHVLIEGRRCPIVGRVMMNHIIVDVSHVATSDRALQAILIGRSEEEVISAETLARWADTIQYEIVTRLGSHLKRSVV